MSSVLVYQLLVLLSFLVCEILALQPTYLTVLVGSLGLVNLLVTICPVLSGLPWWIGFETGLMIGPRIAYYMSGFLLSYLRVCFGLALVGIFPGPLGFGIMLVLVVWIDLLFGLGVWGGAKASFLARLCACCKTRNVE